jgi:hypothetical protein
MNAIFALILAFLSSQGLMCSDEQETSCATCSCEADSDDDSGAVYKGRPSRISNGF